MTDKPYATNLSSAKTVGIIERLYQLSPLRLRRVESGIAADRVATVVRRMRPTLRELAATLIPPQRPGPNQAMSENLPFRIVRPHGDDQDEVLACAANLKIARGAYSAAILFYPGDRIELRQGACLVYYSNT
jgi:hypothetical protein